MKEGRKEDEVTKDQGRKEDGGGVTEDEGR
jgi:hypothetical protein